MGYLDATLTQVFSRAQSGRVTQRCHIRNPRWETGLGSANDVTHRKRAEDLGDFEKVSWVESCLGRRRLTSACSRRPCDGCARVGGGTDGKARIERMCISLLMSKNLLTQKVIKSFVPELRSHKCFSCFEIPMFYVYMLWTFYVRFA